MGKLRWYKRDPIAALEGMSNLTLEEKGAYNTILDLIYAREGAVDDDDRFISGWLRVDVRVWRRIRGRLIELGKLYSKDGALRNSRADDEVDEALSRTASISELNAIKGRKSGDVRRKNKQITEPPVQPNTNISTTTTTREELSLRESSSARDVSHETKTKPKRVKARTPLPDDWQPSDQDVARATERGFTGQQIEAMGRAFKNHHTARGNLMASWPAAWLTWCDNEIKFSRSNINGPRGPQPLRQGGNVIDAADRLVERISDFNAGDTGVRSVEGKANVRLLSSG